MERLTIREVIKHCNRHKERVESHSSRMQLEETPIGNSDFMKQYWEHRQVAEWLKELQSLKEKKEQGLLIELPCKVGDTVYRIYDDCDFPGDCHTKRMCKGCVYRNLFIEEQAFCISMLSQDGTLGHPYYKSRSEAEEALAKIGGKE